MLHWTSRSACKFTKRRLMLLLIESGSASCPENRGLHCIIRCASVLTAFLLSWCLATAQTANSEKPEIVLQTGHAFPVRHIVFSRDARLLASSAFTQNSVELWELKSGRELRSFDIEGGGGLFGVGGLSELALSGNGELLAAASQKEIDVWRVKDGERIYRFPVSGQGGISALVSQPLALSPSGRYIAWLSGSKLELRDLSNRAQEMMLPADSNLAAGTGVSIAFSPDERELAVMVYSSSGTGVDSLDLATTVWRMRSSSQHGGLIMGHALAYSSDGHIVMATRAGSTRIGRSGSGTPTEAKIEIRDLSSNAVFSFEGLEQSLVLSEDATLVAAQDQNEVQIWDVKAQKKTCSLSSNQRGLFNNTNSAVDFSGDGKWVAVGDSAGAIHIVDAHTGKEQTLLAGHANLAGAVAFDEVRAKLYSGSKTVWDLKSGMGLRTIPGSISPRSVAASNGSLLAEDAGHGTVRIWDLALQKVITTLNAPPEQVVSGMGLNPISFSPDGSLLALVRQEDLSTPEAQQRQRDEAIQRSKELGKALKKDAGQGAALGGISAYSPDNPASQIRLFDSRSGAERMALTNQNGYVSAVAFSPDGTTMAAAAGDVVNFWHTSDGKLLGSIPLSQPSAGPAFGADSTHGYTSVTSLSFSPDGRSLGAALYSFKMNYDFSGMQQQILAAAQQGTANASRGRKFGGFGGIGLPGVGHKSAPQRSPIPPVNPSEMMHISTEGPVLVLDALVRRPVATLSGHQEGALGLTFSHDGKLLATSGRDGIIRIWEKASGSIAKELSNKAIAYGLAFSPDDKLLAAGLSDGSTELWDVQNGKMLATLVSLYDGDDWLVVTPDGLFDGSPAAWNQILWRYSRNTFDVAPVEWFFNEYFYPGLLADLVAGKRPKPPQGIEEKDRRQPELRIAFAQASTPVSEREILLKIEVADSGASPGSGAGAGSGAKDVRLFRNGSLVKAWHGEVLNGQARVALEAKVRIVAGENRFTAYAFNHDNVKSRDALLQLQGSASLRREPTTYVLAVGINKFENPNYYLRLAVADAVSVGEAVQREQTRTSGRVQIIPLYDEAATRSAILEGIRRLGSLAQPEDHVILFFASHGTAAQDRFYLLPHDLGFKGQIDKLDAAGVQQILAHSVSDRDLEQALESMDAGKILVIIDACNSGQALESEEKRRGPMNSRGLAQLAYEKGMYILTASQSYQAALEVSQLGHGLLTYALVSEGLVKGLADEEPRDGKIVDREWLNYATHRVPEMQLEVLRTFKGEGRSVSFAQRGEPGGDATSQRPKIFYRRELEDSPWVIAQPNSNAPQTINPR